jgi:hypothetical protein
MDLFKDLESSTRNAIKWIAAEFKYLKELKIDLLQIEQARETSEEEKAYRKVRHVWRYVSRCERRAERNIKEVIEQLKWAVQKYPNLTKLENQIEVPAAQLVRAFSFYTGDFQKKLVFLSLEFRTKSRYFGEKAQQIDNQIKSTAKELEQYVDTLIRWIGGIEASLEQLERIAEQEDRKLVSEAGKESLGLRDSSSNQVIAAVRNNKDLFMENSGNGVLVNIGCSSGGANHALYFMSICPAIKHVHLVDPFLDISHLNGFDQSRMTFHKMDGLKFMIEARAKGMQMNVETSSIDANVVGSNAYLLRLAELIHAVVPKNGFYVSSASTTLQDAAARLFSVNRLIGTDTFVFLKREPYFGEVTRLKYDLSSIQHSFQDLIGTGESMRAEALEWGENTPLISLRATISQFESLVKAFEPNIEHNEDFVLQELGSLKWDMKQRGLDVFKPEHLIIYVDERIKKVKTLPKSEENDQIVIIYEMIIRSVRKNMALLRTLRDKYKDADW